MSQLQMRPIGPGRIVNTRYHPFKRPSFAGPASPSPEIFTTQFTLVSLADGLPGTLVDTSSPGFLGGLSCFNVLPELARYEVPDFGGDELGLDAESALRLADHVFASVWGAVRGLPYLPSEVPLPEALMHHWVDVLSASAETEALRLWKPQALVAPYLISASIAVRLCIFLGTVTGQFDRRNRVSSVYRDLWSNGHGVLAYFGAVVEVIERLSALVTTDLLDGVECAGSNSNAPLLLSPLGVLLPIEHPMAERALLVLLDIKHYFNRMAAVESLGLTVHPRRHHKLLGAQAVALLQRYTRLALERAVVEFGDRPEPPPSCKLLHHPDYAILATRYVAALVPEKGWLDPQVVRLLAQTGGLASYETLTQHVSLTKFRAQDLFPGTRAIQKLVWAFREDGQVTGLLRTCLPLMHYAAPRGPDASREIELTLLVSLFQITLSLMAALMPLGPPAFKELEFFSLVKDALPFPWLPRSQYTTIEGPFGPETRNTVEMLVIVYLNCGPGSPLYLRSARSAEELARDATSTARMVATVLFFSRLSLVFSGAQNFEFAHLSPGRRRIGNNAYFYPRFFNTTRYGTGIRFCPDRHRHAFAFYTARLADLARELEDVTNEYRPTRHRWGKLPEKYMTLMCSDDEPSWPWSSWKSETYASRFGTDDEALRPIPGLTPETPLQLARPIDLLRHAGDH